MTYEQTCDILRSLIMIDYDNFLLCHLADIFFVMRVARKVLKKLYAQLPLR